ncbi:adenine phosphoribosyltransferase [Enhydrobacter sp.]|jgi:adenine phosphoribosyltransferase|uniref:adenine phosphoribosyltransferase n=1 Tax=Enhydrobacter sp. TaxID=1894999 RepID=UPI002620EB81|nr:adenine phosphoribosyltransferase [Enhydrobacter sp.]WIM09361.1 MAG: Adenine phosphoribosyltransferase [Enhydrobacter sp.]
MDLRDHIRSIPDFPKPGILFYDISTLLAHAGAWHETIERMAAAVRPHRPELLAGIESRGFLLAAPLALALGTGFVMLRKQGKLPGITVRHTYALEYGTDTIEIQGDAITRGQRVVLVDDLLATGGTMAAAVTLLEQVGAVVPAAACIIELTFLNGRKRLPVPVEALLQYES